MKLPILTALALSTISLVACSGDDGLSTDHEGVYAVSSWIGTTNGCDGPTAPIAAPDSTQNLYVQSATSFGTDFINVVPCDDAASCQAQAEASTPTISVIGWEFTTGSDAHAWKGGGGAVSSPENHVCNGTWRDATMSLTGTTAHIESREKAVTWPANANDECASQDLEAHAGSAACTSLVTVDATFATDL